MLLLFLRVFFFLLKNLLGNNLYTVSMPDVFRAPLSILPTEKAEQQ